MMEFFHPHIAVTVKDLSEYYEQTSGGGTILYQPFIADKGEDNVLSRETDLATVISKYGKPNFKRHGQAYYNLLEWVKSGGRVYAHRIMPDDACYSHLILNVRTAAAYVPMYERVSSTDKTYDTDANNVRVQWTTTTHVPTADYIYTKPATPSIVSIEEDDVISYNNPLVVVSAYSNTDPNSRQVNVEFSLQEVNSVTDAPIGSAVTRAITCNLDNFRLVDASDAAIILGSKSYKLKVRYSTGVSGSLVPSEYSAEVTFSTAASLTVQDASDDEVFVDDEFVPVIIGGKLYFKDGDNKVYTEGVKVKHEIVNLDACDNASDISSDNLVILSNARTAADMLLDDWDGYKSHYVMAIRAKGKGVWGDLQSISLKLNKLYANTYNYRIYELTALEYDSEYGVTNILEGPFELSFYPDALTYANSSLNGQYVLDNAFSHVSGTFSEDVYDLLVADIEAACQDSNSNDESWVDTSSIDFMFGQSLSGYGLYEKLVIDSESVALETSDGIRFSGGSAGSFSTVNTHVVIDEATGLPEYEADGTTVKRTANTSGYVTNKKTQLYVEAYQGITIPDIINTRFYPIDIAMDANFPLLVKNAILDFCKERKNHTFGIIDTGILYSAAQTLTWRNTSFQYTDWCISIYGQNWVANDDYTGLDMNVTTTYFLAGKIPHHDATYGVHKPIAGPNYGLIEGFKLDKMSWFPTTYEKEDLYVARINYVEREPNQVRLMSQLTAQKKLSQLTEQNNVRVLFKMVATTEDILDKYYFEHSNSATLNSISQTISSNLGSWVSLGACDYVKCDVSQTAEQRERKICGVLLGVKFTPVIERFDCVFEVRRT